MIDKNLCRDYTFEEWNMLSVEDKRSVRNEFWNPYDQRVGLQTRIEILKAFLGHFPNLKSSKCIGFGWFGWYVDAVFVIVQDSKEKVPRHFGDILVNKGIFKMAVDDDKWIVHWRDVGGRNASFNPHFFHRII